ncbi:hypothetical protein Bbelb_238540 [Branchiostoma belcheri]|nr:hypothetical protein Bbelb_238540 [Branchiostoma belcheri]
MGSETTYQPIKTCMEMTKHTPALLSSSTPSARKLFTDGDSLGRVFQGNPPEHCAAMGAHMPGRNCIFWIAEELILAKRSIYYSRGTNHAQAQFWMVHAYIQNRAWRKSTFLDTKRLSRTVCDRIHRVTRALCLGATAHARPRIGFHLSLRVTTSVNGEWGRYAQCGDVCTRLTSVLKADKQRANIAAPSSHTRKRLTESVNLDAQNDLKPYQRLEMLRSTGEVTRYLSAQYLRCVFTQVGTGRTCVSQCHGLVTLKIALLDFGVTGGLSARDKGVVYPRLEVNKQTNKPTRGTSASTTGGWGHVMTSARDSTSIRQIFDLFKVHTDRELKGLDTERPGGPVGSRNTKPFSGTTLARLPREKAPGLTDNAHAELIFPGAAQ